MRTSITFPKHYRWNRYTASAASLALGLAVFIGVARSDTPPVLSIQSLGSNQFSITVTNGIPGTNYTLLWTPALVDENWPWEVWEVIDVGDTNFAIDALNWPLGFFKVLLGSDRDGDGVTEQYDANSLDPAIGVLSITINSPTNGAILY
ncbi:MAG TPA: hypothetical protein VK530_15260 [Candidatus Acidoferrum sp.]|nr:hypothetical protein [Candidatus Acidoferrum sp.]